MKELQEVLITLTADSGVLFLSLQPFTWIVPGVLMGGEKRKAEKARYRSLYSPPPALLLLFFLSPHLLFFFLSPHLLLLPFLYNVLLAVLEVLEEVLEILDEVMGALRRFKESMRKF